MPTVKDYDEKLDQLLRDYPTNLPLRVASKILGVKDSNLREAILQGRVPFAVFWRNDKTVKGVGTLRGQTQTRIPTRKFIAWLQN